MSKKIMKRSLALGALMAFVITGSVFAEAVQPGCTLNGVGSSGNENRHEFHKIYGYVTLAEDATVGNISWTGYRDNSSNYDYNTTYLNGNTLKIVSESGRAVDHGGHYDHNGGGYIICEDLPGYKFVSEAGKALGHLEIQSNAEALYGYGIIDVDTLTITSASSNAIVSGDAKNSTSWMPFKKTEIYANSVVIEAKGANAIQAHSNMEIGKVDDKVGTLAISGDYDRAIRVNGKADVYNGITPVDEYLNASITVNVYADTLNISGAKKSIKADDNGTLNLNADKGTVVSDIEAGSTGTINVTFGSGVNWSGAFTTADDATGNVTLNGATWKVTGDSNITTLKGNDGKIELAAVPATYSLSSNNNGFVTLQIGDASDSSAVVTGEGLTEAVENGELTAEEALKKLSGSVIVEEGTATLALEEGETTGATSATVGSNGMSSVKQEVNTKAAKASKAATNLKAHYRAHMNDMNKRMGELRMANGEAGVWTRMVRGESEYEGAKMQYNQYQLGYDEKLSIDKRWTVGAAVAFAEGDGGYGQGSTEDKSTAFAIYGSKLNNDGTDCTLCTS